MPARRLIAAVFGLTFLYAIVRYVFFHDVSWENVPLYVLNKSVSWSGVILFGCSIIAKDNSRRRELGVVSAAAILAHLIMSVMVLEPAYFDKFFHPDGRMNAVGELSMLAGVVGTIALAGLFAANMGDHRDSPRSLRRGWGRIVLWSAIVHVTIMGYAGWLAPGDWPGYLPPITLLSLLTGLYFLVVRMLGRRP